MILSKKALLVVLLGTTIASSVVAFCPTQREVNIFTVTKAGPKDDADTSAVEGPRGSSRSSSSSSGRRMARPEPRPARARRPRPTTSDSSEDNNSNNGGPNYQVATKRAPHQHDHKKADARPFIDAIQEIRTQDPNPNAPVFGDAQQFTTVAGPVIEHAHVETTSLDALFPQVKSQSFSALFSANAQFRNGIRNAMRQDIFDATPAYAGMSEKARTMLLLPDSSLQGSWRCQGREETSNGRLRMKQLTRVLQEYLGADEAPTGDEFMDTIGGLCGSKPQTHWIDIVGITDRKISHSWHQDTGRSPNGDTKTVLLGFPREDNYVGVGVFSHLVKLEKEQWAPEDHPPVEPVLYKEAIDETYIYRPQFACRQEIIMYRDVDVLHSSPDVAFRSSVMRFM